VDVGYKLETTLSLSCATTQQRRSAALGADFSNLVYSGANSVRHTLCEPWTLVQKYSYFLDGSYAELWVSSESNSLFEEQYFTILSTGLIIFKHLQWIAKAH
jgi:hypothetical protein